MVNGENGKVIDARGEEDFVAGIDKLNELSFDEKLAFLIMMTDPELVTFKEFLKVHLPSISSISNIENQKERTMALEERHQILQQFETAVREQIGFYDVKLLKFEEQFFKRFYSKKELITQVGQHNEDGFLLLAGLVDSFDNITDERFKELVSKIKLPKEKLMK